jgi:hypothetical protein
MSARLREQLEGALQVATVALVVVVAFVASHVYPWNVPTFRVARSVFLLELAFVAVAILVVTRARPRLLPGGIAVAGLALLGLLSAAWSPDPELTLERAIAFAILVCVAWAIALGTAGHARQVGQVLLALLAATVLIALAGLVELWRAYDQAVVPATRGQGARYNGIGQNPNQIAMLIALTLPLAVWAVRSVGGRGRAVGVAVLLVLGGSLLASGSRGAILAAAAGCLVYALATAGRRRIAYAAVVAAVFGAAIVATQLPPRAETDPILNTRFGATPQLSGRDLDGELPLESEFGFPGQNAPGGPRTLIFSSGRTQAWEMGARQALERPIAGYGFGTEDRVFVDRSYLFVSSFVENSFLGVFLQLGAVGLAVLLAALALPLVAWLSVARGLDPGRREVAAACAAVVVAGVAMAVPQSFLTSVGSPPTAPFWISLFLLAALAGRSAAPRR